MINYNSTHVRRNIYDWKVTNVSDNELKNDLYAHWVFVGGLRGAIRGYYHVSAVGTYGAAPFYTLPTTIGGKHVTYQYTFKKTQGHDSHISMQGFSGNAD